MCPTEIEAFERKCRHDFNIKPDPLKRPADVKTVDELDRQPKRRKIGNYFYEASDVVGANGIHIICFL